MVRYCLIADDDPCCRELMSSLVESLGFGIFSATNGREALKILDDHNGLIEALVTDFQMPFMGGGELIQSVKRCHKEVKLIVLVSGSVRNIAPYFRSELIHTCHKRDVTRRLKDYFCKMS